MVPNPPPADLGRITDAVRLAGMLPFLRQETERMVHEVETRVFTALKAGALTPDAALLAWMEVSSHRQLLKKLETQVKIGQSLGAQHAVGLETRP